MNSYYEKFLATGEVKCIDEEIPFEIPNSWEWTRINGRALVTYSIMQVENSKAVVVRVVEHHRSLLLHPIYIGGISSLTM